MKIIDEKGRLFGKINIIDFLVIVVFVCILPMFYYGYKIFSKQSTQTVDDPKVFTEIERYCKFIELEPEDLGLIIKGDKEIGEDGNIIGEIVWVGEPESYFYILDLGSGETIIKEDFNLKELLVKLKLRVGIRGGDTVYYKDKRFVVNSPIEFTTDKYSLAVIPKSEGFKFGKTAKKTLMIDLDVVLKGIEEDTLKLISSGDKEVNAEGETIAEILALGKAGSDAREIDLGNGNFVLGKDSGKRQIFVKMRLECAVGKDDRELYFKGAQLRYNSPFEFKTDKYSAQVKIAKMYESMPSPLKEKWLSLQVKFSGIIPEVANVITEGDVEKDPTGKITGRLKAIISSRSSDVLILKKGKFITLAHPFQKDVVVLLDLFCVEKDGILYFKNYPVKMGNAVTFTTDLYSISGMIVGVENK